MTHITAHHNELPDDLQPIAASLDRLARAERETCPNPLIDQAGMLHANDTARVAHLLDVLASTERSTLSHERINQIVSDTANSVRTRQTHAHADLLAASEQAHGDAALEERVFAATRCIIATAQQATPTDHLRLPSRPAVSPARKLHVRVLSMRAWRQTGLLAASVAVLAGGAAWLAMLDGGKTGPGAPNNGTSVAVIQRVDDDMDAIESLLDFTLSTASVQEDALSLENEAQRFNSDQTNEFDLPDELMELEGMS